MVVLETGIILNRGATVFDWFGVSWIVFPFVNQNPKLRLIRRPGKREVMSFI